MTGTPHFIGLPNAVGDVEMLKVILKGAIMTPPPVLKDAALLSANLGHHRRNDMGFLRMGRSRAATGDTSDFSGLHRRGSLLHCKSRNSLLFLFFLFQLSSSLAVFHRKAKGVKASKVQLHPLTSVGSFATTRAGVP